MLLDKISRIIDKECFLNNSDPVIVGVSGGVDSLCLLDVLVKTGFQVVVAHFNHSIRPEAKDEAFFVHRIGTSLGVPVVQGEGSVPEHANKNHISLEESARRLRYRFLFNTGMTLEAQAVAVAHNADDQVETILMHLLRGTGLNGLIGMSYHSLPNPWSDSIPLVRPFLHVWREDIEIYAKEHKLEPVEDRTNLDRRYLRNQIRHEFIPMMNEINPGFKQRLWNTADLIKADQAILKSLTDQVWQRVVVDRGDQFVSLNLQLLIQQPCGIQRRLILKAAKWILQNPQDIDYNFMDRVISFYTNPSRSREVDIGRGLRACIEDWQLVLSLWKSTLPRIHWPQISEKVILPIPGEIHLGSNWKLRCEKCDNIKAARKSALTNEDSNKVWIDPGGEIQSIFVRGRFPGDRFQPLGMEGRSIKISDYMINRKIPRRARGKWPLVCVNDEISWIVGSHLAHPSRIKVGTSVVLKLTLETISPNNLA